MKIFALLFLVFVFTLAPRAQAPDQVLATAGPLRLTIADLPPETAADYVSLSKTVAELRRQLLDEQVAGLVFELEAKAKNVPVDKYLAGLKAKVPDPSEAEVAAVYENNRAVIGSRTLAEIRPEIVRLLRREPEQRALAAELAALRAKYKIAPAKDVNALALRPTDVLATVGAKSITVRDFEEEHKVALYEAKARVFDDVKYALGELLYNNLLSVEAKAENLATSDLLAREVTDKKRSFTPEEGDELESALRRRLFEKYKAQILLKEPAPLALDVTTADAPSKGPAAAPVTVVMFSDFQCSHCAATHPVLERVLAEYPGKVRFVVRDFPLESIHPEAFQAAVAANAAQAQGKFFEYVELLYRNQNALDAASLKRYAAELGLNVGRFELDLQSEKNAEAVRRDLADGARYGITGTPTVFVNGVRVRLGTAAGFREAIDRALKK